MDRLSEVEILVATYDEPHRALMRSAVEQQRLGRLDACARIAADQVKKRPRLKWPALLLALDSAELLLAGAVKITTPAREVGFFDEEHWGGFEMVTYPEKVRVDLELLADGSGYALYARCPKKASDYDPLLNQAFRALTHEIAAHLHATVWLERT